MGSKRLPRDAAERVLRRAVELSDQPGDADDTFDLEVLIAAAGDLGVPSTAVERAIAEEHAGLLVGEPDRLDRFVGPAAISAARVVGLDGTAALALTDQWLRSQWAFKRVRGTETVAEYRRRTDMVASMQRTARSMSGKDNADKVRNLRVVVHDLPPSALADSAAAGPAGSRPSSSGSSGSGSPSTGSSSTAIVAIVVDIESSRAFAEMGAGVVAGGGTFLSTIATVANDAVGLVHALPLLGIPVSAGMGLGVLATRKAWTGGIDVALEGLLDRVESGEPPTTVLRGLTDRLRGSTDRPGGTDRPGSTDRPGDSGPQEGSVGRT